MTPFWSVLITVKALPGKDQVYAPGSVVFAQCFVPVMSLEEALPRLDAFLAEEHFRRIDISSAYRFDLDDPEEEYSLEIVKLEGREAVATGRPRIGWFVSGRDTAQLLPDADA